MYTYLIWLCEAVKGSLYYHFFRYCASAANWNSLMYCQLWEKYPSNANIRTHIAFFYTTSNVNISRSGIPFSIIYVYRDHIYIRPFLSQSQEMFDYVSMGNNFLCIDFLHVYLYKIDSSSLCHRDSVTNIICKIKFIIDSTTQPFLRILSIL